LKSISRNCAIEWMAWAQYRSRLVSRLLVMLSVGHHRTKPPLLLQAAELFGDGLTVREVAATLRISKSEAGRLRLRALAERLVSGDQELSQVAVQ